MSTVLRTSKLIENCTISISYDRQVQAASEAFDNQCYEIIDDTPVVSFIGSIMAITDSNLVDILAWQFHVDFYDKTRDFTFRKTLVQKSITWHMRKGTYALVQEVLDTYWPGGATLLEWFNYYVPLPPGIPANYWAPPQPPPPASPQSPPIVAAPPGTSWHDRYRFRIYIDNRIIDPNTEQQVLDLVNNYKPISRWCEGIFHATFSDCSIGWCGMMLMFVIYTSERPTNYP